MDVLLASLLFVFADTQSGVCAANSSGTGVGVSDGVQEQGCLASAAVMAAFRRAGTEAFCF